YNYPGWHEVLPALRLVAPVLRGGKISTAEEVKACWVIVGFGLSRMNFQNAVSSLTHEQSALLLDAATENGLRATEKDLLMLPCLAIVKLLLPLLLEWLVRAL